MHSRESAIWVLHPEARQHRQFHQYPRDRLSHTRPTPQEIIWLESACLSSLNIAQQESTQSPSLTSSSAKMDDEIVLRQPMTWSWSMIHLSTWSRLIVLSLAGLLFLLRHECHLEVLHRTQKPIRPEYVNVNLSAISSVNLLVGISNSKRGRRCGR